MSAFIVAKAHIDAIVTAALDRGHIQAGQEDAYGQELVKENVRSVERRYDDAPDDGDGLPGPIAPYYRHLYTWEPTRVLSDAELSGAIAGLTYQSCEHHEWADTEACRNLEALDPHVEHHGAGWVLEREHVKLTRATTRLPPRLGGHQRIDLPDRWGQA